MWAAIDGAFLMRRLFLVLFLPAMLFPATCNAGAGELTVLQADALARLAFEHKVAHIRHGRGYSLDPFPEGFDPGYSHFQVLGVWHDPSEAGSAVLGGYAVNRQTAEVWDTYAECFRVRFPALQKMQQRLSREAGIAPHPKARTSHSRPRLC
jgi:hypothetical protein